MADTPEAFDVIVMPNLYGDSLSDVAAQIAGSVGLAGSSNIGTHCAMFEAIHGSAPRRAGQNLANPSGLLLGAVLMLVHIGQHDIAERVHNAWLSTMEAGIHTYDVYTEGVSKQKVGTKEFAQAVSDHVGKTPQTLKAARYKPAPAKAQRDAAAARPAAHAELEGIDVYVAWPSLAPNDLADVMRKAESDGLKLTMIDNRGVKVWPGGMSETFCVESFRCRFSGPSGVTQQQTLALLGRVAGQGLDIVKTESLRSYDGQPGYTLAQGQ
jgi:isocitrate dehydrogenase